MMIDGHVFVAVAAAFVAGLVIGGVYGWTIKANRG